MTHGGPTDLEARIAAETERLCADFAGVYDRATVERCVAEGREAFASGGIQEFLPSLIYRYTQQILGASARARGAVGGVPEILFVCVHNAGRSQMAAALAKHLGGSGVVVRTAGSAPRGAIHPAVVEALREIGLDAGEEFPKPLADAFVLAADVIVTMGCGDACPVFPGKRYEDWKVDDPAGRPLADVRGIREDVRRRVVDLLTSLGVEPREERRP